MCLLQWPEKKIKLDGAISEILVADIDSESGSEASDFEDFWGRRRRRRGGTTSGRLGTASRKEHKYLSFCQTSKRCEKKWDSTYQQRQLATVCVDVVFHRNFSFAGWTDQVYYQQQLDRQTRPSRRLPDVTLQDMMTFIALALQVGPKLKDTLHDYLSRLRQLHAPFYGETMAWDRFLHILRFQHFADNSQRPDEGEEYDRLWKLRTAFDKLNEACAKFCNP